MFNETQKDIAELIFKEPKTIKEISDKLHVPQDDVKKELRLMLKLGVIEKEGEKFRLIRRIEEDVSERLKGWKDSFRAIIMLDFHGSSEQSVEDGIGKAIEEYEQNPGIKILSKKKEDIIRKEGNFSGIIELELATKKFEDLMDAVSRNGVSSLELLYPDSVTLNLEQAQAILMHMANVVIGYENILRFLQSENKALREQIGGKGKDKV